MKRKKLNALLALTLAFSMAFCEPATALASGITEVSVEEDNGSEETEEVTTEQGTEETAPVEEGTEAAEESNEEIAEESTEESSEEAAEESTEESSEEAAEESTEENSEETAEESTEEVTETVTEEVTEESTETVEESSEAGDNSVLSAENQAKMKALGFQTMELSQAMLEEKADFAEVASAMASMKSGEDYIENEVVYFAEDEETAAQIAACYGGTVTEYEYGVAVASIKQSVNDAVTMAAIPNIMLPAVYPNIVYKINDGWDSVSTETEEAVLVDEADVEHEEVIDPADMDLELPCEDEHLYATAPNDTYFDKQWHHTTMNTVEAWNATKGEGVTVAVLDTGIDYDHPDLKANILDSVDVTGTAAKGKDGNGHGTHCAGIIAATANNGVGVSGMAPEAKIYSVKVLKDSGSGSTADITQGVIAATAQNVDVISMSLGGYCWDSLYQQAIDNATKKGIVVVAAAGNDATSQKSYPAAYNNVIAVAATDQYDQLTYFSNYGTWVDIAAPGLNILSTLPTGYQISGVTYEATGYGYMSGTSMACPVVAGEVALMLGNSDTLKNTNSKSGVTKVTKALLNSAIPDGAWSYWSADPNYAYPLADAEASTFAVDESVAAVPTIKFSQTPSNKNVVLAGSNEYFELSTTTEHAKIYYTLNGKKPTAETGILYTGKIYMPISGKVKIQAVTVVGSKTSKVFSKTYTFDVKAKRLSSTCSDNVTVAAGKSMQLSVDIAPSYVSSKKLTWSSDDATKHITVSKTGKVTCKKGTEKGFTAVITAATTDGSDIKKEFKVTVVDGTVEKVKLNATELNMSYWVNSSMPMKDESGNEYVSTFQLVPECEGEVTTTQYLYKSSNTKVATVDATGRISARGKGKATITVTANDGSGKKATCKVTVVTPVFDVYTYSSTGFSEESDYIPIGTGCSITMKTIVNCGSSYYLYTPNNKKLEWTSSRSDIVSVSSSGKVKCNASAPVGTTVTITATAKDGFGGSTSVTFKVVDKIEKIYCDYSMMYWENGVLKGRYKPGKVFTSLSYKGGVGYSIPDLLNNGFLSVKTKNGTNDFYEYFTVDTSNRDVVYRYYDYDEKAVIILGTKPGSSKITYTARDGSGKKFTINCKISK